MSLSIAVIAIPGILTTTIFLLFYYVFVIKCCLNRRSSTPRRHTLPSSTAAESAGLDPAAISSIPTFRYSSIPFPAAAECAVCLSDFRSGERLRLIPCCAHAFHIDCIDAWLQSKTSCPLCRSHITDPIPFTADRIVSPIQSVVIEVNEEGIRSRRRRLGPAASMGDECVEVGREKDEFFAVQPLRRSLSLDSFAGGGGGGRARRSFFPFGPGRNTRSAVQPVGVDVL